MKVRALRKLAQEKHGYWSTVSWRRINEYVYEDGAESIVRRVRVTRRCYASSQPRQAWRAAPLHGGGRMTYQCKDREPFAETVLVPDGWSSDGRRILVEVPFTMAKDCRYSHSELGQADAGCTGCRWREKGDV